jgi:leucyl-tRNA synthetase
MKFNTAIASLMSLINEIYSVGRLTSDELITFIKLLCPFAPHICEEINESLGGKELLSLSAWPEYDEEKTKEETAEIALTVNGKLRGTITLPVNCEKDEAVKLINESKKIALFTEGKVVIKEIYVPNKIYNIVVK